MESARYTYKVVDDGVKKGGRYGEISCVQREQDGQVDRLLPHTSG